MGYGIGIANKKTLAALGVVAFAIVIIVVVVYFLSKEKQVISFFSGSQPPTSARPSNAISGRGVADRQLTDPDGLTENPLRIAAKLFPKQGDTYRQTMLRVDRDKSRKPNNMRGNGFARRYGERDMIRLLTDQNYHPEDLLSGRIDQVLSQRPKFLNKVPEELRSAQLRAGHKIFTNVLI